jgi:hypothetical protein
MYARTPANCQTLERAIFIRLNREQGAICVGKPAKHFNFLVFGKTVAGAQFGLVSRFGRGF